MAVFFVGIGIAAMATALAQTPTQIMILLFFVGVLAAIYHPVGLAMVVEGAKASGAGRAIGINGIWGNMGVGSAALITGFLIDHTGWRAAFVLPGLVSVFIGVAYWFFSQPEMAAERQRKQARVAAAAATDRSTGSVTMSAETRAALIRLSAVIFFTTAVSSIVFQSTTFALPKVLDERLTGIAGTATLVGWLTFIVFAVASAAQLLVGTLLDRLGPRIVFMGAALVQMLFFTLMPGRTDWAALAIAVGFMLGAFGQIPINDYMIGRMARSELRASIYGVRYVVSFAALAAALPLIAYVHGQWGFDTLFRILAAAGLLILLAASLLPRRMPEPTPAPAE
jgi:MFS family permease